jgi:hypothetical protein
MPPETVLMQNDHKHWLAEIERWQGYARAWGTEQRELRSEFETFLDAVRHYGEELNAHAAALEEHKSDLLASERTMVERPATAETLSQQMERHHDSETHHTRLRGAHERLKQTHHTLVAALAILKHQPCRD